MTPIPLPHITFEEYFNSIPRKSCFVCPLKWSCGLWLNSAWNTNWFMCNCTDDRIVCGINEEYPLVPKRYDLIEKFKKGIDTSEIE